MLFDSLQLSGVLLGNVDCVAATPCSLETQHFPQKGGQFQEWPIIYTSKKSGTSSLPNQVYYYHHHHHHYCGRRGGLMVSVLDSGANGPCSGPGREH